MWNKVFYTNVCVVVFFVFCVCGCFFFIESRESIETNELHEITHNVKEMQEEKGGASVHVENKNCVGPLNYVILFI